ncbi:MAG: PhoX family protein, partial [Bacteroidota bacterium]|nr:PhoX family protein [Bacteroidota bacterium]
TSTTNGIDRLCSASLFEAGTYNLEDDLFITGEEADNGQAFILDVDNADLYCAPWLGRGKWENGAFLQHSDPSKVALLIGDDTQGAPLYLYIGEKDHFGNNGFLDRNGLAFGTLHVFVANNGFQTPQHVNGTGTIFTGAFQPITHFNVALAGTSGYDAQGFAHQTTQYTLGNSIGNFHFSRPEDVATDPYDPTRAVYASTGRGQLYPADDWGTTYIIDVDFTDLSVDVRILYDGDDAGDGLFTHPDHGLRSPDNVDWSDDGSIYVQEDKATNLNSFGGVSGQETSIWRIDPFSGQLIRIAMVDRSATFSDGQSDTAPGDFGNWETSGILDVTSLFDQADKVVLIAVVQANSVQGGAIAVGSLAGGGQLLLIEGPASNNVLVDIHANLGGPYDPTVGLMNDVLRSSDLLPLQHPYGNPPFSYSGTESISAPILATTGNNAITDWVLVELRSASNSTNVINRRAALIQRDGDVVDVDGVTPLRFTGMISGSYYIALRHRNHLGVMTATTRTLGPLPTNVDMAAITTDTYGSNAQRIVNNVRMLWSGDVNGDGVLRYTGAGNDRDPILIEIGGIVPTNVASGYHSEDVDLNGQVRYTGNANDRDIILQNINGVVPTEVRIQQMP